jgi:hypothetical protein
MAVTVNLGAAPACQNPAYSGGNITITGLNGGTNFPANCTIVICVGYHDNGAGVTAATIGGVAMTAAVSAFDSSTGSGGTIYYADVSSSTGDTLVLTNAGSCDYVGAVGYYLTGAATGGPSSTNFINAVQAAPLGAAVTIPSNGAAIAAGFSVNTFTPTWANTTSSSGDLSTTLASNILVCSANATASGSQTPEITATGSNYNSYFADAAWAASGGGGAALTGSAPLLFM